MENLKLVAASGYDRAREVKEFDESKVGVKGLLDAGVTTIPRFFHHPVSSLTARTTTVNPAVSVPVIDLSLPRSRTVELVTRAARDWGFFQVTNHGAPLSALSAALSAVQAFNELPTETKATHYSRDMSLGVSFNTNFDLYRSNAATWRDTLQVQMDPTRLDLEKIPEVCREELLEWDKHARHLAGKVMGLLSEGLGTEAGRLEELSCLDARMTVCHFYPHCPQPELTLGLGGHTDPGVLTVLIQNEVGGLLVKKASSEESTDWVEVDPVPGAVIINVGDTLQMISNDVYKSAEHMVVANSRKEPRVSVAIFYNPGRRDDSSFYGPLTELISKDKPAVYRQFTMSEYMAAFLSKQLGSRSLLDNFRV